MLVYEEFMGRPFELSKADCFSLVSDLYKENFGIEITNYARPKDWSSDDIDIIGQSYSKEGFEKLTDWSLTTLQPGDLMAMAVGAATANHLAVYVGGNKMVHHLMYQFSREETLRDFWRKSICYVIRHKDVTYTSVENPSTTIEEILNDRYNKHIEEAAKEG